MANAIVEDTAEFKELQTNKFGMGNTAPTAPQTGWSVTNSTTDRTIDANGAVAEIGDGLTSLITDLIAKGIISA